MNTGVRGGREKVTIERNKLEFCDNYIGGTFWEPVFNT